MNTPANIPIPLPAPRLHPLVATAAVALTLLSAAGIAAFAGWLPAGREAAARDAPIVAVAPEPTSSTAPAPAPAAPQTIEKVVIVERAEARRPLPAAPVTQPAVQLMPVAQPVAAPILVAQQVPPAVAPVPSVCYDCGVVESLRQVVQEGEGSGLGAVAGGVVGGLLGNQVGRGSGKSIATVLGVAGGAYAGHQIEKSQRKTVRHEVTVRMADGTLRTVLQDGATPWRAGDRVRIENGTLVRNYN